LVGFATPIASWTWAPARGPKNRRVRILRAFARGAGHVGEEEAPEVEGRVARRSSVAGAYLHRSGHCFPAWPHVESSLP